MSEPVASVAVAQRRLLESFARMGEECDIRVVRGALRLSALADWFHRTANDLESRGGPDDAVRVLREVAGLAEAFLHERADDSELAADDPRGASNG